MPAPAADSAEFARFAVGVGDVAGHHRFAQRQRRFFSDAEPRAPLNTPFPSRIVTPAMVTSMFGADDVEDAVRSPGPDDRVAGPVA